MALAYKVSDIIVSASNEPESFGRVSVEAQSMGKPIIASNIGGSNETIIDEKTGFLFNSGDVDINIDVGHSNGMRINRNNANHPRYTNPSIGEWTHFVTTAPDKSTDPSLYVNGSLQSGTGGDFGTILSSGSFLGNFGGGHISNVYTGLMAVFKVYDRENKNCVRKNCKGKITKIFISNRSSFFCKFCQK